MTAASPAPWDAFVGRHVVLLFVHHRDDQREAACRSFEGMGWPSGYERRVVGIDDDPEVARFFGIRTTPCIAIVVDGSLVSVEHECSEDTCRSLLEQARVSYAGVLRARV